MNFSSSEVIKCPTPVREIKDVYQQYGVKLIVKEDYQTHPIISGNKWRKLNGNLQHMQSQGYEGIISFGGAHSNHLYALAGLRQLFDIPVIVLVRGDGFDPENETLAFAKTSGVKLYFIDRAAYREKERGEIANKIISEFPNYLVIPEGGSNQFALSGIQELYSEIKVQIPDYSHLVLSMGTGGTAGGLLSCMKKDRAQMVVYPALKGDWMQAEIINYVKLFNKNVVQIPNKLTVRSAFHFGGYGKIPTDLLLFIDEVKNKYDLPLDPIYTGKAFFGLMEDIKNKFYKPGDIVVFIHTGGLRE
ncbi:MAG TPA: pyridoxal-phosphate dependent enzyme [Saprospiraceae bacterium]|nr:pyridoxal-phosphate dependent enzyme [Saprospiraceae bacterium]HPN69268.1 pyridoxal-phosphate dependent enzyme [Saprospiraceae bacterium]